MLIICRNKNIQNVISIDLHGQHVKQAMRLLKMHLLLVSCVQSKNLLGSFFLVFHSSCSFLYNVAQLQREKRISLYFFPILEYCVVLLTILFFLCSSGSDPQGYHRMWDTWCGQVKAKTNGICFGHPLSNYFCQNHTYKS